MTANSHSEHISINILTQKIEANLTNNQFGVSDLAKEMGMSRSNLHRRIKALTNQSISQFLCKVCLEKAMELLYENSDSASEVAYNVGFSSPSYFSRCFHKYFGYPPGEVKIRFDTQISDKPSVSQNIIQLEYEPQKTRRNQVLIIIFQMFHLVKL